MIAISEVTMTMSDCQAIVSDKESNTVWLTVRETDGTLDITSEGRSIVKISVAGKDQLQIEINGQEIHVEEKTEEFPF